MVSGQEEQVRDRFYSIRKFWSWIVVGVGVGVVVVGVVVDGVGGWWVMGGMCNALINSISQII